MNLLAPFKACMQCLPVFSSDSPRPSSAEKPHPEKNAHALASPSPAPHGEKPSFSDSSLIHDNEPKTDLPVSEPAKIELGLPHSHSPSPHSTQPVVHVYDDSTPDARHGVKGDEDDSHHKAAQPASVKEETSHKTGSSPHPSLHAGVDFSSSGLMRLPSPLSPTPIGLGYVVGPHSTSHHIHHQVHSHPHEAHDKTHPLSSSSHSTEGKGPAKKQPSSGKEHAPSPTLSSPHPAKEHESPPPVASSGKPHEIPPVSASSESGKGSHDKEHSHHHLRIPHHQDDVQDSESGKGNQGKEHSHHQHFHIGLHHHPGDVQDHAPHPSPVPSKNSAPQHAEAPHTHDKKHLETSHSAPQVNRVPSHGAAATGASSVLEKSHSEPIEAKAGTGHGHFFKDLQDKLKQGGHHLKEEGSKHLHNIVSFTEDGSKHLHNILNFTEEGSKHRHE